MAHHHKEIVIEGFISCTVRRRMAWDMCDWFNKKHIAAQTYGMRRVRLIFAESLVQVKYLRGDRQGPWGVVNREKLAAYGSYTKGASSVRWLCSIRYYEQEIESPIGKKNKRWMAYEMDIACEHVSLVFFIGKLRGTLLSLARRMHVWAL